MNHSSIRDKNIRYIRRYIFDISDISDVRHDIVRRYIFDISDIDDVRHDIADISILDRCIVEISGMCHAHVLV